MSPSLSLAARPVVPGEARLGGRVAAIDLVRGAVMVLMALDHVRVYAAVPAGGATAGLFLTRWITHFCAPAFVFLAGTSAYLQGRKRGGIAGELVVRGAWLIGLELTLVRLAWTFNLDVGWMMAGVLWAIGWSMIALAGLSKLPLGAVVAVGLVIVGGHDLVDPFALARTAGEHPLGWMLKVLHVGFFAGPIRLGEGASLIVLYSLVPWVGVMALGYAFGRVVILEPARRDRACLALGLGALGLFLVLRGFDLYGDPRPWRAARGGGPGGPLPAWIAFLNTSKYPASLAFLLMTLGPTVALLPALERARGWLADALARFGRVPFFFYLLHLPLIHALALAVSAVRDGSPSPWLFENHPMGSGPPPPGYAWSLPLLYAIWALAVALLYLPCRWFAGVKARRSERWLRFL